MYKLYIEKNIVSDDFFAKTCNMLGISDKVFYNEYGKPYFENNDLFFNISHSGDYTVLVISDKEIGVDIEKISYKPNIIDRICTDNEKKTIHNADDFTKVWVKKASYVKWLGQGLSYGLNNVDTTRITNFDIKKIEDYYVCVYTEK